MNNNQPYKRQYRQLDDDVKQKISDSTRNKPKSEEHKEQIRKALHVQNTKLLTVLSADANPIADFLDNIVQSESTVINMPDKKTYMMTLVLKDCDYDLEKVEAKLRSFIHSKGTSIKNVMKPYIALMGQMTNNNGADLWQDARRKLM